MSGPLIPWSPGLVERDVLGRVASTGVEGNQGGLGLWMSAEGSLDYGRGRWEVIYATTGAMRSCIQPQHRMDRF
ncbi:hypothetical protein RRG08_047356 [Elysia crispata]|uniref:Uncharacterized protein n=1 Tax=Elysia crispata TaxID=231223 RepID=A0AAE1AZF3_9GAST|nr:hypothetical protein RRG08_047356 [Elysia crispata]